MNFVDSPEKNISAIVSCLADDRVARGGEHVQLGHLGEHLEDLGLLQGVVGDVLTPSPLTDGLKELLER